MQSIENIQEIKSLISLLDDPDDAVYHEIAGEILKRGAVMISWLEEAWGKSDDKLMQDRIEKMVHRLQFGQTLSKLEKWVAMGQDNLLLGALIIAKFQYPNLKEESIIRRLGHITQDIYLRIKEGMTPLEKIRVVNTVLYDEYEFFGNKRDYQSPQCTYLNMVFETGKGNHLSLGVIYILVARSLGIPVVGIDLKDYFFLGYQDGERMLFYVNPFSRGNTLTPNELLFFLKLAEVDTEQQKIEPASNLDILRRMVIILIDAYKSLSKHDKATEMQQLMEILQAGRIRY